MKRKVLRNLILLCAFLPLFICGCSSSGKSNPVERKTKRTTKTEFLTPQASGVKVIEAEDVKMDLSNVSEGYLMVKYENTETKAKLMITVPDGVTRYVYTVAPGAYRTFPLSCGNGTYQINMCEQVEGDQYAVIASSACEVKLADEYRPFLYPNTYVWYTKESECVQIGKQLSDESADDLEYVEKVYNYVVGNISYDDEKARTVQTDYIPDLDLVLKEKKGICFDYSSLMTALLRSQGIPTKMVFGYSGTVYHAWISVYLDVVGWVDNMIEFDGLKWSLMDPTLDANSSNNKKEVEEYVKDTSHYTEKFWY